MTWQPDICEKCKHKYMSKSCREIDQKCGDIMDFLERETGIPRDAEVYAIYNENVCEEFIDRIWDHYPELHDKFIIDTL